MAGLKKNCFSCSKSRTDSCKSCQKVSSSKKKTDEFSKIFGTNMTQSTPVFIENVKCATTNCFGRQLKTVPCFLIEAFGLLRLNGGFKAEGIFRRGANEAKMKSFWLPFHGCMGMPEECSPFDIAYLIKKFFRVLAKPLLLGRSFQNQLLSCLTISHEETRIRALMALVQVLPPSHIDTFAFLCINLREIEKLKEENKMNMNALCTCIVPTLFDDMETVDPRSKNARQQIEQIKRLFDSKNAVLGIFIAHSSKIGLRSQRDMVMSPTNLNKMRVIQSKGEKSSPFVNNRMAACNKIEPPSTPQNSGPIPLAKIESRSSERKRNLAHGLTSSGRVAVRMVVEESGVIRPMSSLALSSSAQIEDTGKSNEQDNVERVKNDSERENYNNRILSPSSTVPESTKQESLKSILKNRNSPTIKLNLTNESESSDDLTEGSGAPVNSILTGITIESASEKTLRHVRRRGNSPYLKRRPLSLTKASAFTASSDTISDQDMPKHTLSEDDSQCMNEGGHLDGSSSCAVPAHPLTEPIGRNRKRNTSAPLGLRKNLLRGKPNSLVNGLSTAMLEAIKERKLSHSDGNLSPRIIVSGREDLDRYSNSVNMDYDQASSAIDGADLGPNDAVSFGDTTLNLIQETGNAAQRRRSSRHRHSFESGQKLANKFEDVTSCSQKPITLKSLSAIPTGHSVPVNQDATPELPPRMPPIVLRNHANDSNNVAMGHEIPKLVLNDVGDDDDGTMIDQVDCADSDLANPNVPDENGTFLTSASEASKDVDEPRGSKRKSSSSSAAGNAVVADANDAAPLPLSPPMASSIHLRNDEFALSEKRKARLTAARSPTTLEKPVTGETVRPSIAFIRDKRKGTVGSAVKMFNESASRAANVSPAGFKAPPKPLRGSRKANYMAPTAASKLRSRQVGRLGVQNGKVSKNRRSIGSKSPGSSKIGEKRSKQSSGRCN